MPILTLDQIDALCADALRRAGASDEQAAIVAEEIMDAEAEGIRNVGSATCTFTEAPPLRQ